MANSDNKWSMSNEREFIENLLYQRINFLIVFYGLILGGALNADSVGYRRMVLILGAIVCILFATSIWLLQPKLEILIRKVREEAGHPAAIVYAEIQENTRFKFIKWLHDKGVDRILIGYLVPWICSLSLLIAIFIISP